MTRAIQHVAFGLVVAFFIISLAIVYWQILRGPVLAADRRYNVARRHTTTEVLTRGRIVDRHGAVLAESVKSGDGAERRYPYPGLAHVVGYADVRFGAAGLEEAYDAYLSGERSPDPVTALTASLLGRDVPASTVVTTIDMAVQKVADAALGDGRGAVLAFDVRTGDVLALASHPYIDPNSLARDFERVRRDENAPLVNRVTQGRYPPGSTFKILTLAAALDTGVVTTDAVFQDPDDGITIDGYFIADPNHPGITTFNTLQALALSSNSAFARIGLQLGGERLAEYARRFRFGAQPTFDLPVTPSVLIREPAYLETAVNVAVTAIGQGQIRATPFQMGLVVGSIATGGELPRLRVVHRIEAPSGVAVAPIAGGTEYRVMSPGAAEAVRSGMVLAVDEGGVGTLAVPGVAVAAKSGTAEVGGGARPHAWIVAFAPADRARVAVVVIKENAGGGATVAGPIARQILQAALAATAE